MCTVNCNNTLKRSSYIFHCDVFIFAGLCSWAINIIGFFDVFCDVEPKRKALQSANDELAAAQDKLSKIKAKIKVCVCMACDCGGS